MPVKMTGEPSEFNGRPAFDFSAIEQLPVEFHIAPALALSRQGIPAAQSKKLIAAFGDDCIAKVVANRDILATPGLRFRPAARKPNAEQVQGIQNGLTESLSILQGRRAVARPGA